MSQRLWHDKFAPLQLVLFLLIYFVFLTSSFATVWQLIGPMFILIICKTNYSGPYTYYCVHMSLCIAQPDKHSMLLIENMSLSFVTLCSVVLFLSLCSQLLYAINLTHASAICSNSIVYLHNFVLFLMFWTISYWTALHFYAVQAGN